MTYVPILKHILWFKKKFLIFNILGPKNMDFTNKNGDLSFGGLMNAMQNVEDATSMSLTQYTRRCLVNSRVYIDNTIANEEILGPFMMNLMNLYVGLIMTAMNMNQQIQGTRKVRDSMSVVATEDFEPMMNVKDAINSYFFGKAGMEDMYHNSNYDDAESEGTTDKIDTINPEPKDITLPSGRIIRIDVGNKSNGFTVNLLVQLQPNIIPADVARQFIAINFKPSFSQRWMQASAGEISFISDLLLGNDLRRERFNAMRHDKTGTLQQMEDRRQNNLSNMWLKLAQISPEKQNIANTILIYEKNNFEKACNNSGINFKIFSSRQKFFAATMSMMVCAIDPMYNKAMIYYNGIGDPSVFTFDQIKKNAKTESTDILAMMKNYAQGMAPRF